jgi:signal transduction histidine kinase
MANDIQSYTGWPLAVTDINGFNKVVGVLVVNYKERREVDEEQARFLHHLAALAGIAIEYIEDKQQRYANEQLAALGSATTALQHRLSNTINVTLPAVMRLRYRVGQDPESQKILDVIERNTEFANDVVRRMRYPLRQEEFAPVDFGALLNKAISDCLSQNEKDVCLFTGDQTMTSISDASIVVISRISSLPESYARSSSLTEVFRVLVENAVKAVRKSTHSPGKITITGRLIEAGPQNRQEVEVIVEDNGEGMSDETKQRLFRQPVPRKEFGEGAGLGLWLSNIIIKSHRGTIAFASQLGEGTTFRLRLPILTQPPVEQSVLRSLSALEGGAE